MTLARQAGHDVMSVPRVPRTRAMGTFPFDAAGRGRRGIGIGSCPAWRASVINVSIGTAI